MFAAFPGRKPPASRPRAQHETDHRAPERRTGGRRPPWPSISEAALFLIIRQLEPRHRSHRAATSALGLALTAASRVVRVKGADQAVSSARSFQAPAVRLLLPSLELGRERADLSAPRLGRLREEPARPSRPHGTTAGVPVFSL